MRFGELRAQLEDLAACAELDVARDELLEAVARLDDSSVLVRDGGCMWPGCGRPPSYCEAHHCDHWWEDVGSTDIDRGILLCRFHHMALHHGGWKISREGLDPFVLHPPPGQGEPVGLVSKSAAKWAWDPPPPPDRSGWRELTIAA